MAKQSQFPFSIFARYRSAPGCHDVESLIGHCGHQSRFFSLAQVRPFLCFRLRHRLPVTTKYFLPGMQVPHPASRAQYDTLLLVFETGDVDDNGLSRYTRFR